MAEKQSSKIDSKRHTQPISIPFIWEEKPGTPIKDWKPASRPVKPVDQPVKLVVSVPFGWEEKPGTPLSDFSIPRKMPSQIHINQDQYSYTESDTYNNETEDESFTDSPAYETECSFNMSYATRSGSLSGSSFVEWLFPLHVPNSSYMDKHHSRDEDAKGVEYGDENEGSQVRRPLLTLGDLIVMSRRMSYKRKVTKMHKQSSMDFMKGNACFGRLHNKLKRHLILN